MLNSSKTREEIDISPTCFSLLYPFFIQAFDLSLFVTGDFEEDKWTIAKVTAPIMYQKVYGTVTTPYNYSYIALWRFLHHMCLDKNDFLTVNFYKSKDALFLIDEFDILATEKYIFNTPFLKIYENDFYPGFRFLSKEEQQKMVFDDYEDKYNCYVTILTDVFPIYQDDKGRWVGCPTFDENIRKFLYEKYKEIYELFLVEYRSAQIDIIVPKDVEERFKARNESIDIYKRNRLSWYENAHKYLLAMIDLFNI